MLKVKSLLAAVCVGFALASAGTASAVDPFVLPTPENNANASYGLYPDANGDMREAIIMNGIPIAFKYDSFWSYSAKLLTAIQTESPGLIPTPTFGTYSFSTGTGTIDINLSSVAQGATNTVTGLSFQDPVELTSNQQVTGWECVWGDSIQSCAIHGANGTYADPATDHNGVTTVGNLLAYLQGIDALWSVPIFYADYNQTGSGDSLFFSAMVEIKDATTGDVKATWSLDSTLPEDGILDPTNPTFNYGQISFLGDSTDCAANPWDPLTGVGCAGVTDDGADYTNLDHNRGSGQADFLIYARDMDLLMFDEDDLFVVTMNLGCIPGTTSPLDGDDLGCNTNGGEEFGIMGGVGAFQQVPEPGTLLMLGVGLAAAGFVGRRRVRS